MTRPTGSKPASRTRRNSLTERSLVKSFLPRISTRRSRACAGRSDGSSVLTGSLASLVGLEPGLLGLLGGDLDVRRVVLALDVRVAPPPERHHREDQGRRPVRLGTPPRDAPHAGAEPAHVDVEVVEHAAAGAARHLADRDLHVAPDDELGAHALRLGVEPARRDALRLVDRRARVGQLLVVDAAHAVRAADARRDVPDVVAAELEEEAARLEAVLGERPEVLPREVRDDRAARGVRDPARAHGGADDRELEDLAAVVAALAARAHRDHAVAQVDADDGVGAEEHRLLLEPIERVPPRGAVPLADRRDLGGLPLVVRDLPHVEDARAHDLRDRLAARVAIEDELAHREVAREEALLGAALLGEALLGPERDPALLDAREARLPVDRLAGARHQSRTVRTSAGFGISWSSRIGTTAVPTALNSRTLGPQVWLFSSIVTPTIPAAESASASTCMRSMASSRAS